MSRQVHFLITALAILTVGVEGQRYHPSYHLNCPRLYPQVFKGYIPRGNLTSGNFTRVDGVQNVNRCVTSCCTNEHCNIALINDGKCYHVACVSSELCMPVLSQMQDSARHVSLALVKPVSSEDNWWDLLNTEYEQTDDQINRDMISRLLNDDHHRIDDEYINDMLMDETAYGSVRECEVGLSIQCGANEECMRVVLKSRNGICQCKDGYERNNAGVCRRVQLNNNDNFVNPVIADRVLPINMTSSAATLKHLTVSVVSKEVRLPENDVNLVAYAVPVAAEGHKYQYEWTLQKQPSGSNTIKDQNEAYLHLSKLSEGLYTFKVSVSSEDAYGETYANVTVLPPKRINQPPRVIINPQTQTVKLPNTGAVLDASGTKDDDGILSWHWELQQGPLGYQPRLTDTPTLQLNNLAIPGNYTFKVTVTDTDHATNSSTANITVLKITDYPPEANAGQDVIIYLPHNKVTLNGNLSTDDRAIVTWEWTKSSTDADKAADMQDTRTPYLSLSNLEEGMYTFILKVTDSANQSSSSEVHVFVKPPTNIPPTAEAGENVTISLPQTWTLLDGTKSKDDNKIVSYLWEQVEGPAASVIKSANMSNPNVTSLTKGKYVFKLSVTDDNGNLASDSVTVVVTQNKNQRPVANAGGDQTVTLPASVIFLNGSASSDDLAVVKWRWEREAASLAVGQVSQEDSAVLLVVGARAGRYVFRLTVWDEQGLTDTDTVSLMVKEDPLLYHLVDLTVEADTRHITLAQFQMLLGKLALLVKDGTRVCVRGGLRAEGGGSERAVVVFYVETPDGKALAANDVVHHLRQKLQVDESLLGLSIVSLQTSVCQNQCSGHGVCNEQTRKCLCEAFWMQDLVRLYAGDGDADCRWSVLYVVVALVAAALTLAALCWALAWLCLALCTKRRLRTKPQTYSLLGDTDDPVQAHCNNANTNTNTMSDTDTDSDVLFESRNKAAARTNGLNMRNGLTTRNGFIKLGRRVNT